VLSDGQSVLVKPDAALAQMLADEKEMAAATAATAASGDATTGTTTTTGRPVPGRPGVPAPPPPPPQLRRFHASVALDPLRLGRDASTIAQEVVQHLTGIVGAEVEVTLMVEANLPDGASDKPVRDVTENCRTLKFTSYGFEES
jgi:hypothetical protein